MKTADGGTIMVDKSTNVYKTTSKLINKESCNEFFNLDSRTL